jgi:hypothetical protein
MILRVLDRELMETQSLVRSTAMSTKAALCNVKRRSSRRQLILET